MFQGHQWNFLTEVHIHYMGIVDQSFPAELFTVKTIMLTVADDLRSRTGRATRATRFKFIMCVLGMSTLGMSVNRYGLLPCLAWCRTDIGINNYCKRIS